jgi:hypothetical protein
MKKAFLALVAFTVFLACGDEKAPTYSELLEGKWRAVSVLEGEFDRAKIEEENKHRMTYSLNGGLEGTTVWFIQSEPCKRILISDTRNITLDAAKKTIFFEGGPTWVLNSFTPTMDIVKLTYDSLVLRGVRHDGVVATIRAVREE